MVCPTRRRTMYCSETGSSLEKRDGIFVLRLCGSPYNRGRAHGKLLKAQILDSNISRYYGNFLLDLYRTSDIAKKIPRVVNKNIGALLEIWYYTPLERLLLPESRDELYGMADEVGLKREEVLRGYVAPDIMTHLAAVFLKGGARVGGTYQGGCSGVYARNGAMRKNAPALFARNMDFPGVFVWKYPAVVFSYPEEDVKTYCQDPSGNWGWVTKRKQPYVYICAAGFPGNGLTGMSANGVAMSTFVCLSRNISRNGMLTLDFNHYLLTRTESMSGILRLVAAKEMPACATPHTVVFADQREAVSLETDSTRTVAVTMDKGKDIHVQTNHYVHPGLKKKEFSFPLEEEQTLGRYRLLTEAAGHNAGNINLQKMVDIISCNSDCSMGLNRLIGDFPAQPTTLTSVVFEPKTLRFWVASGTPPAVCYNRYVPFTFNEKEGLRFRTSVSRSRHPVLSGAQGKPVSREMLSSLNYCMLSQESLKSGKLPAALRNIRKAREIYADPGYAYILALLLMKTGDYGEALSLWERLDSEGLFSGAKHEALLLWKARTLDLLDRRKEAVALYRNLNRDRKGYALLRQAAQHNLRKSFNHDDLPGTFDYTLLGPYVFK